MRPFGDVVGGFPRLVRDLARDLGKRARLELRGRDVLVDRDVLDALDAPVNHMLRNAVDHGVETPERRVAAGKDPEARIVLEARHRAGMLEIQVGDDGGGVDYDTLRRKVVERGLVNETMGRDLSKAELLEFLFLPAFSTKTEVTAVSGRGVGLDVVHTLAHGLGGAVRAESVTGRGFDVILTAPITRSVLRAALVGIAGEAHALPLARIERLVRVPVAEIRAVEGRESFTWEGAPVGLVPAARALGLDGSPPAADTVPVVLLAGAGHFYGLVVDEFLGEQDLVVRALDPRLGKVENVAAVSVDEAGAPVLIDVDDLLRWWTTSCTGPPPHGARHGPARGRRAPPPQRDARRGRLITVREVERGCSPRAASSSTSRWTGRRLERVASGAYDLVVSDVDMPRMNGIEMVRRIKQDPRLRTVPVMIVSYKDREEDRLKGLGPAPAYVTKSRSEDAWIGRVCSAWASRGGRDVRVAVVNDLRLAVEVQRRMLAAEPGCELAWVATNGAEAVERCRTDLPDLVLMDLVMPVMDGVEATRRIMRATPCPILVVTSTVEGHVDRVYDALGAGALDAVATPTIGSDGAVKGAEPVLRKLRTIRRLHTPAAASVRPSAPDAPVAAPVRGERMILLGASTGGPEAVAAVLRGLAPDLPAPIVLVQHLGRDYVRSSSSGSRPACGPYARSPRASAPPAHRPRRPHRRPPRAAGRRRLRLRPRARDQPYGPAWTSSSRASRAGPAAAAACADRHGARRRRGAPGPARRPLGDVRPGPGHVGGLGDAARLRGERGRAHGAAGHRDRRRARGGVARGRGPRGARDGSLTDEPRDAFRPAARRGRRRRRAARRRAARGRPDALRRGRPAHARDRARRALPLRRRPAPGDRRRARVPPDGHPLRPRDAPDGRARPRAPLPRGRRDAQDPAHRPVVEGGARDEGRGLRPRRQRLPRQAPRPRRARPRADHSAGYRSMLSARRRARGAAPRQAALQDRLDQAARTSRRSSRAHRRTRPHRWGFHPSASLGERRLRFHWLDDDHFVCYLLDVSGHGVGAALLGVSVLNALRSRSLRAPTSRPRPGARGPRRRVPMSSHGASSSRSGTASSRPAPTLRFTGGGHPPRSAAPPAASRRSVRRAHARPRAGPRVHHADGRGPAGLPPLLYSDGLYEIRKPDGSAYDHDEMIDDLAVGAGSPLDRAVARAGALRRRRVRRDVSAVEPSSQLGRRARRSSA
jgi:chemotaxis response regulator CheB